MPEWPRNRDCVVLYKGDSFTLSTTPQAAVLGWKGGQGMMYAPTDLDDIFVTQADGYYAGFALWGSNEPPDEYTSMTRNQPAYQFVTLGAGGWVIMTTTYEKYTWASRQGPGPLVLITYHASDRLVFSLRGYWTKEDEWTLSGDPRAPNNYYLGFVMQVPSSANQNYMTIQVSL